ncbi:hypothetical protein SDC9_89917 [bioreactor metagenome]|uniref:GIY-YIG domain-containing protein n=1 Tax=bioreactor metagenome TaxID=1076179 RepID=A0A645A087_9ZZZZ
MNDLQVYILTCSDGSFYTGVTNDVESRFIQHSTGLNQNSYTYSRRPLILSWVSDQMDPDSAIELEKQIKKWTRAKKKALIDGNYDSLIVLSKKKFNK